MYVCVCLYTKPNDKQKGKQLVLKVGLLLNGDGNCRHVICSVVQTAAMQHFITSVNLIDGRDLTFRLPPKPRTLLRDPRVAFASEQFLKDRHVD